MYHIIQVLVTKSSYNLQESLEPFALKKNKMSYNAAIGISQEL